MTFFFPREDLVNMMFSNLNVFKNKISIYFFHSFYKYITYC